MGEVANMTVTVTGDIKNLQSEMAKAGVAVKNFGDVTATSLTKAQQYLAIYQRGLAVATNPTDIARYTAGIKNLETQISQMTTVGKIGMKELSNSTIDAAGKLSLFEKAAQRATSADALGARAITRISRSFVGFGIGFLGGAVFEGIQELVTLLSSVSDAASTSKKNLDNLNEVMADADKEAGKETANLKILYDAATNVSLSARQRYDAVKALQELYPEVFGNMSTEAIENGKLKISYDELTKSIRANALAKAGQKKLEDLQGQYLEEKFNQEKIRNATTNEAQAKRLQAEADSQNSRNNTAYDAGEGPQTITQQDVLKQIIDRREKALIASNKRIQSNLSQQNFITDLIGGAGLANAVEGGNKKEFERAEKDLKDHWNRELATVQGSRAKILAVNKEYQQKEIDLKKEYGISTAKSEKDLSKLNNPIGNKNAAYDAAIKELDVEYAKELEATKGAKLLMEDVEVTFLLRRIEIYKKFGKDYVTQTKEYLDKVAAIEKKADEEGFRKTPEGSFLATGIGSITSRKEPGLAKGSMPEDLIKAGSAYARLWDTVPQKIKDSIIEQAKFQEQQEKLSSFIQKELTGTFDSFFQEIISGNKDVFSSFSDLLKNLVLQLTKTALEAAALAGILSILGLGIGSGPTAIKGFGSIFKHLLGFAEGGSVYGPGSGTSDSIPARLSHGEYVINAVSASKFGRGFLDSINNGFLPRFSGGGSVGDLRSTISAQQVFIPAVTLRGQDMVIAFNRANQTISRNG